MTRTVIDTIGQDARNIPSSAPAVMFYPFGDFAWSEEELARLHGSKIPVDNQDRVSAECPVQDCETGAKTIEQAVQSAQLRQRELEDTTIYVQGSRLDQVRAAVAATGPTLKGFVTYCVANWNLSEAEAAALLRGDIVAVQWASPTSNPGTLLPGSRLTLREANCDLTVCVDSWHAPPKPPRKHKPIPKPPAPVPKVTAGTLAAAIAAVITAAVHAKGLKISTDEAKAIVVVAGGLAGYFFPAKPKASA